jgi:putative transposase
MAEARERCEMEQAGRILRAQATRKQVFHTILPLLTDALIKPADGTRKTHKDYQAIKEQVSALRESLADPDSFMAMTNVIEQACNHFLETESWPTTYEELQPVPVLKVGQLTFAGDDGRDKGQTYRARIDFRHVCLRQTRAERTTARLFLQLRAPDGAGTPGAGLGLGHSLTHHGQRRGARRGGGEDVSSDQPPRLSGHRRVGWAAGQAAPRDRQAQSLP